MSGIDSSEKDSVVQLKPLLIPISSVELYKLKGMGKEGCESRESVPTSSNEKADSIIKGPQARAIKNQDVLAAIAKYVGDSMVNGKKDHQLVERVLHDGVDNPDDVGDEICMDSLVNSLDILTDLVVPLDKEHYIPVREAPSVQGQQVRLHDPGARRSCTMSHTGIGLISHLTLKHSQYTNKSHCEMLQSAPAEDDPTSSVLRRRVQGIHGDSFQEQNVLINVIVDELVNMSCTILIDSVIPSLAEEDWLFEQLDIARDTEYSLQHRIAEQVLQLQGVNHVFELSSSQHAGDHAVPALQRRLRRQRIGCSCAEQEQAQDWGDAKITSFGGKVNKQGLVHPLLTGHDGTKGKPLPSLYRGIDSDTLATLLELREIRKTNVTQLLHSSDTVIGVYFSDEQQKEPFPVTKSSLTKLLSLWQQSSRPSEFHGMIYPLSRHILSSISPRLLSYALQEARNTPPHLHHGDTTNEIIRVLRSIGQQQKTVPASTATTNVPLDVFTPVTVVPGTHSSYSSGPTCLVCTRDGGMYSLLRSLVLRAAPNEDSMCVLVNAEVPVANGFVTLSSLVQELSTAPIQIEHITKESIQTSRNYNHSPELCTCIYPGCIHRCALLHEPEPQKFKNINPIVGTDVGIALHQANIHISEAAQVGQTPQDSYLPPLIMHTVEKDVVLMHSENTPPPLYDHHLVKQIAEDTRLQQAQMLLRRDACKTSDQGNQRFASSSKPSIQVTLTLQLIKDDYRYLVAHSRLQLEGINEARKYIDILSPRFIEENPKEDNAEIPEQEEAVVDSSVQKVYLPAGTKLQQKTKMKRTTTIHTAGTRSLTIAERIQDITHVYTRDILRTRASRMLNNPSCVQIDGFNDAIVRSKYWSRQLGEAVRAPYYAPGDDVTLSHAWHDAQVPEKFRKDKLELRKKIKEKRKEEEAFMLLQNQEARLLAQKQKVCRCRSPMVVWCMSPDENDLFWKDIVVVRAIKQLQYVLGFSAADAARAYMHAMYHSRNTSTNSSNGNAQDKTLGNDMITHVKPVFNPFERGVTDVPSADTASATMNTVGGIPFSNKTMKNKKIAPVAPSKAFTIQPKQGFHTVLPRKALSYSTPIQKSAIWESNAHAYKQSRVVAASNNTLQRQLSVKRVDNDTPRLQSELNHSSSLKTASNVMRTSTASLRSTSNLKSASILNLSSSMKSSNNLRSCTSLASTNSISMKKQHTSEDSAPPIDSLAKQLSVSAYTTLLHPKKQSPPPSVIRLHPIFQAFPIPSIDRYVRNDSTLIDFDTSKTRPVMDYDDSLDKLSQNSENVKNVK